MTSRDFYMGCINIVNHIRVYIQCTSRPHINEHRTASIRRKSRPFCSSFGICKTLYHA